MFFTLVHEFQNDFTRVKTSPSPVLYASFLPIRLRRRWPTNCIQISGDLLSLTPLRDIIGESSLILDRRREKFRSLASKSKIFAKDRSFDSMGICYAVPVDPEMKKAASPLPTAEAKKEKKRKTKRTNPFSLGYHRAAAPGFAVLQCPSGGDIAARYDLGRELGRGEFGTTFLCTDRATRERFACKSISKRKLRSTVDIEDARREVEIMRHLPAHPNLVSLKETYEDGGAVHLVMELCEGGELFDRIVAKGRYTERAAASVIRTIVEVVQMCHRHGVMHRDLKPENFLFGDSRENAPLKAIDFGLSQFFRPGNSFYNLKAFYIIVI